MGDSKRESFHSYPAKHLYEKKVRSELGNIQRDLTSGNRHLPFLNDFFIKWLGPE